MNRVSAVIAACLVIFLLASCGREKRESQQGTTASSAEAVNQEGPPQDFVTVDQQPELVKKAEPLYPELAKKAGMEGMVWVKIWVDTTGKAREVTVLKSDADVFNQPTLDAAKQFEFKPARIKGKPVSVWVSVPFKYKLADKPDAKEGKGVTRPASPEEMSFMRGYVAAKEDLLRDFEKITATARKSGKPNLDLEQQIQKLKSEIPILKEALRAMKETK